MCGVCMFVCAIPRAPDTARCTLASYVNNVNVAVTAVSCRMWVEVTQTTPERRGCCGLRCCACSAPSPAPRPPRTADCQPRTPDTAPTGNPTHRSSCPTGGGLRCEHTIQRHRRHDGSLRHTHSRSRTPQIVIHTQRCVTIVDTHQRQHQHGVTAAAVATKQSRRWARETPTGSFDTGTTSSRQTDPPSPSPPQRACPCRTHSDRH